MTEVSDAWLVTMITKSELALWQLEDRGHADDEWCAVAAKHYREEIARWREILEHRAQLRRLTGGK